MVLQAAGLALLAALSPTALLIVAVYLGSARPKVTALIYLTGALLVSVVGGIVILVVLRSSDLNHPDHHTPRYGLRLGLGILLLVVAVVVGVRKARPPDPDRPGGSRLDRLVSQPGLASAFLAGVLVFAPGFAFLAALQVIATSSADLEQTVLAMVVVIGINVLLVWGPIVLYVLAPGVTARRLTSFNGWLRANGKVVLVTVLVVVGALMIENGTTGLAAVVR